MSGLETAVHTLLNIVLVTAMELQNVQLHEQISKSIVIQCDAT